MVRHLVLGLALLTVSCALDSGGARASVNQRGGVLTSADGIFSIEIPEGALASRALVTITTRRLDATGSDLGTRLYEVSPLDLVPGASVKVRYRAPRTAWVGLRTIATFDDGATVPAEEADYDHLDHIASASYRSLERRLFGLATIVDPLAVRPCSSGCDRGRPGCMVDPVELAADHCPADGWDDPPNTGLMFVLSEFAIAKAGVGFDVDRRCKAADDCIDNRLARLGEFANDQIRQGLLGGEMLLLGELAGVEHPGDVVADSSLTVKFYEGQDFDDPFFPANNFRNPPSEARCCEFLIDGPSLEGRRANARARLEAKLDQGTVSSLAAADTGLWGSLPVFGLFDVGTSSTPFYPKGSLHDARVSLRVEVDEHYAFTQVVDGLLGGVVYARELAAAPNPYCRTLNNLCASRAGRVLDMLITMLGPPDIDVDGDGFEVFRIGTDGTIVACLDGDGSEIPPVDPGRPASCAESPRVDDGYSVAYRFQGVAAKVKGVTPAR
ncbi:MAG: hypothetical protein U1E65_28070 [Myxococcota bacterium]